MCSEAILEFEESLAAVSSSHELLLNNLELKADLNRFVATRHLDDLAAVVEEPTEAGLLCLFSNYDYTLETVATCLVCRSQLAGASSPCCFEYIEQQKQGPGSALEQDYWTLFLANPYKTILTLPNYTKMAFNQMGVPFQLRAQVWRQLVLINQKNYYGIPAEATMIFSNFQHSYNQQISDQIKKDLTRTFPDVEFFQRQETVDSLLTILCVYANYDMELGYCQGLLFLVGTLFQQLGNREFTFHTMCKIMECEPQMRSIFVPGLMFETLEAWRLQFCSIFALVDRPLYEHLTSFCDMSVFLYQWWLSNNLIHTPNLSINSRIVESCLTEGWKIGNFKVSLGLLLLNRPILMSFGAGDEEVVYQHLLNESKWGSIVNNTTSFFGDLLLSWDDKLFTGLDRNIVSSINNDTRKASLTDKDSLFSRFKNLSIRSLLILDSVPQVHKLDNRSLSSVFSSRDNTSLFSEATDSCGEECNSSAGRKDSFSDSSYKSELDDVILENQALRFLLKKAYDALEDTSLKREIGDMIDVS